MILVLLVILCNCRQVDFYGINLSFLWTKCFLLRLTVFFFFCFLTRSMNFMGKVIHTNGLSRDVWFHFTLKYRDSNMGLKSQAQSQVLKVANQRSTKCTVLLQKYTALSYRISVFNLYIATQNPFSFLLTSLYFVFILVIMISESDTAQADMIRVDQYRYVKNCAFNSSNSGVIIF